MSGMMYRRLAGSQALVVPDRGVLWGSVAALGSSRRSRGLMLGAQDNT